MEELEIPVVRCD